MLVNPGYYRSQNNKKVVLSLAKSDAGLARRLLTRDNLKSGLLSNEQKAELVAKHIYDDKFKKFVSFESKKVKTELFFKPVDSIDLSSLAHDINAAYVLLNANIFDDNRADIKIEIFERHAPNSADFFRRLLSGLMMLEGKNTNYFKRVFKVYTNHKNFDDVYKVSYTDESKRKFWEVFWGSFELAASKTEELNKSLKSSIVNSDPMPKANRIKLAEKLLNSSNLFSGDIDDIKAFDILLSSDDNAKNIELYKKYWMKFENSDISFQVKLFEIYARLAKIDSSLLAGDYWEHFKFIAEDEINLANAIQDEAKRDPNIAALFLGNKQLIENRTIAVAEIISEPTVYEKIASIFSSIRKYIFGGYNPIIKKTDSMLGKIAEYGSIAESGKEELNYIIANDSLFNKIPVSDLYQLIKMNELSDEFVRGMESKNDKIAEVAAFILNEALNDENPLSESIEKYQDLLSSSNISKLLFSNLGDLGRAKAMANYFVVSQKYKDLSQVIKRNLLVSDNGEIVKEDFCALLNKGGEPAIILACTSLGLDQLALMEGGVKSFYYKYDSAGKARLIKAMLDHDKFESFYDSLSDDKKRELLVSEEIVYSHIPAYLRSTYSLKIGFEFILSNFDALLPSKEIHELTQDQAFEYVTIYRSFTEEKNAIGLVRQKSTDQINRLNILSSKRKGGQSVFDSWVESFNAGSKTDLLKAILDNEKYSLIGDGGKLFDIILKQTDHFIKNNIHHVIYILSKDEDLFAKVLEKCDENIRSLEEASVDDVIRIVLDYKNSRVNSDKKPSGKASEKHSYGKNKNLLSRVFSMFSNKKSTNKFEVVEDDTQNKNYR